MFEKKCKFQCKIKVVRLTQTPYLCGNLYCKLRLINGNFVTHTKHRTIKNHEVTWNEEFDFKFNALLQKNKRILKPSILRISVRMDSNKIKPNKIGFLDLNLSEFSGLGEHHLGFHLKGYRNSDPPDNSILEISVDTNILQGNVIFKPNQEATANAILEFSSIKMENSNEEITEPSIETVHPKATTIPILSRNLYSPWFKGNQSINDEILNMNVRGSARITATRLDNDQITDSILSSTFLCMQPGESSQLELCMTNDGKPVLGQTLTAELDPSQDNSGT